MDEQTARTLIADTLNWAAVCVDDCPLRTLRSPA